MSHATGGEKFGVVSRAKSNYKACRSLTDEKGIADGRDAGHQRGRLRSTSAGTEAQRLGASCAVGIAVSPIAGTVPAGVGAGAGRRLAGGAVAEGAAAGNGRRLGVNSLILSLHEDGCSCAEIARELGWTQPKTKRKLVSLGLPTGHARRARAALDDLGPDISYRIQVSVGHGSPLLEFRFGLMEPDWAARSWYKLYSADPPQEVEA